MKQSIELNINGEIFDLVVEPQRTLLEVLRDDLDLTGAKGGCGTGECGACTVLMDGKAVLSCLVLASNAQGKEIFTVEGLAQGEKLHPLQQSFIDKWAFQCGFCTSGMLLSAKALLDENPEPTEEEVNKAIAGNLCRCTGYVKPVEAILDAAKKMSE